MGCSVPCMCGGIFADVSGIIALNTGSASDAIQYINQENVGSSFLFSKCDFLNSYFIQMGF